MNKVDAAIECVRLCEPQFQDGHAIFILRDEVLALRESLRLKTEELEAAKRGLEDVRDTYEKRCDDCDRGTHYYHDEPVTTRMVAGMAERAERAEAALASSQQHHAYDNWRKDGGLATAYDGYTGEYGELINNAMKDSTPQEAEAWAKAQKYGKEK